MNFFLIKLVLVSTAVSMVTADSSLSSRIGVENEAKIVGGAPSAPHAHPYQVSIQAQSSGGSWSHFCGGVIVSSEKIVTAAHCLVDEDISNLRIVAGEHDLSVAEGAEQIVSIKSAAIHPLYNDTTSDNDFAYLYLLKNLTLNENVAAIQLASFEPSSFLGSCVSVGWGNTKSDGSVEFPAVLQQVPLAIVPKNECNVTWEGKVTSNMVCAGGVEGQDSCNGDSGGPLICTDGLGQKYLGGIVSFGTNPCAQKGIPGIYSNVFAGRSWLQERALCPAVSILPCICTEDRNGEADPSVQCDGSEVTQETLNKVMSAIRSYNGLTSDDLLSLNEFGIGSLGRDTSISTFDLTPFLRTNITRLSIAYNRYLTSIVGPVGDKYKGSIKTKTLSFYIAPITDEGLGDALRYFDPLNLESLGISYTQIHGGHHLVQNGDVEFLPGLSLFKDLKGLTLEGNPITEVSGGQFKLNSNLLSLSLASPLISNTTDFGPSAFLFNEPDPDSDLLDKELTIYMMQSKLREDNFKGMENSGLLTNKRPVYLYLQDNYFEYIPEEYFRSFLDAHPGNRMRVAMSLICDQRMQWLKYNADIYRGKVELAICRDDPVGQDVFDTNLIS